MSTPITNAGTLPVSAPAPVVSVSPVVLSAQGRPLDLQMPVSAPVTGRELTILLLSHGHGNSFHLSSLNGCAPLADYWAAHGFVVIQPTHLTRGRSASIPTVPKDPCSGDRELRT